MKVGGRGESQCHVYARISTELLQRAILDTALAAAAVRPSVPQVPSCFFHMYFLERPHFETCPPTQLIQPRSLSGCSPALSREPYKLLTQIRPVLLQSLNLIHVPLINTFPRLSSSPHMLNSFTVNAFS